MFGSKCDDDVGRFGFVRLQAIPIGVAPVGNVHHLGQLCTRARGLGRLHDVESVAVEDVCYPNKLFSCGTTGWLSGMASPRNWLRVRSTCADVNFIAHSFRSSIRFVFNATPPSSGASTHGGHALTGSSRTHPRKVFPRTVK